MKDSEKSKYCEYHQGWGYGGEICCNFPPEQLPEDVRSEFAGMATVRICEGCRKDLGLTVQINPPAFSGSAKQIKWAGEIWAGMMSKNANKWIWFSLHNRGQTDFLQWLEGRSDSTFWIERRSQGICDLFQEWNKSQALTK